MAIDVFKTKMPVLAENIIIRFKADGGMVLVDSETNQETDELRLFIKNRPADDEMRRNKSMNDIDYKKIELELIDMALPVDLISVENMSDGGTMLGYPVASSEFTSKWPEIFEYIKKALILNVGVGNIDAYSNLLSSNQNDDIGFKITKDREDEWVLKLVESRSNNDFRYEKAFVKLVENSFQSFESVEYGQSVAIIMEKSISNFDYVEEKLLDLDLMLRIQVIADVQLIIGNGK